MWGWWWGACGQTWRPDNSPGQWSRDEHHLCLLYLRQTNNLRGQRQTSAWRGSLPTEWQAGPVKVPQTLLSHSWPCWPLPYPTTDPTLRTISRAEPRRRPHDLIKCNYHQLLVLGGGSGGDYLLEGNIRCFPRCCTFTGCIVASRQKITWQNKQFHFRPDHSVKDISQQCFLIKWCHLLQLTPANCSRVNECEGSRTLKSILKMAAMWWWCSHLLA